MPLMIIRPRIGLKMKFRSRFLNQKQEEIYKGENNLEKSLKITLKNSLFELLTKSNAKS